MNPVKRVISTNPQVIPLNTYGPVGAGIYISGAATASSLADCKDITTIIAAISSGTIDYPADGILIVNGVGQTVIVSQYGD